MKKHGKLTAVFLIMCLTVFLMTGCGGKSEPAGGQADSSTSGLSGKTLHIYCGAGLSKPFEKIAQAFKDESGCEMEVVYANAAQIHTQIKTAGEGDLFIAGSAEELAPVEEYVSDSKDLVKHIPVLAVRKENPLGIAGLNDLAKEGVEVVLGDADATPIGKISNKALTDLGIMDKVNIIARAATAPELFNALSLGECDAIVVWKENVTGDDAEIINTADLDKYIKTVPAASLSFNEDSDTLNAFLEFLDTDKAKNIWMEYGYEVLN